MSGLMLSGKKAKNPFYIQEIDKNIYTMEELCYYLYNNIYMISYEFFTLELSDFIENELELTKVSENLRSHILKRSPYTLMIKTVLDGSFYYSENEKNILANELQILSKKSPGERIKDKADILLRNRRFESALKTYRSLLERKDRELDEEFLSKLWNNIGIIYAKLFLYSDAFLCFSMAIDLCKKNEYIDNLIFSAIMDNNDVEIKRLQVKFDLGDEEINKYNSFIDEEKEKILNEEKTAEIVRKIKTECICDLNAYYKSMDDILNEWKMEYRQEIN